LSRAAPWPSPTLRAPRPRLTPRWRLTSSLRSAALGRWGGIRWWSGPIGLVWITLMGGQGVPEALGAPPTASPPLAVIQWRVARAPGTPTTGSGDVEVPRAPSMITLGPRRLAAPQPIEGSARLTGPQAAWRGAFGPSSTPHEALGAHRSAPVARLTPPRVELVNVSSPKHEGRDRVSRERVDEQMARRREGPMPPTPRRAAEERAASHSRARPAPPDAPPLAPRPRRAHLETAHTPLAPMTLVRHPDGPLAAPRRVQRSDRVASTAVTDQAQRPAEARLKAPTRRASLVRGALDTPARVELARWPQRLAPDRAESASAGAPPAHDRVDSARAALPRPALARPASPHLTPVAAPRTPPARRLDETSGGQRLSRPNVPPSDGASILDAPSDAPRRFLTRRAAAERAHAAPEPPTRTLLAPPRRAAEGGLFVPRPTLRDLSAPPVRGDGGAGPAPAQGVGKRRPVLADHSRGAPLTPRRVERREGVRFVSPTRLAETLITQDRAPQAPSLQAAVPRSERPWTSANGRAPVQRAEKLQAEASRAPRAPRFVRASASAEPRPQPLAQSSLTRQELTRRVERRSPAKNGVSTADLGDGVTLNARRAPPSERRWPTPTLTALRLVRATLGALNRVLKPPIASAQLDDARPERAQPETPRVGVARTLVTRASTNRAAPARSSSGKPTVAPAVTAAMPLVRAAPPRRAEPHGAASPMSPASSVPRVPRIQPPASAPRRLMTRRAAPEPKSSRGGLSPELQALLLGAPTRPPPAAAPSPPPAPPLERELLHTLKALTRRDSSAAELLQDIERQLKALRRLDALRRV
jgi:hypothetical protein